MGELKTLQIKISGLSKNVQNELGISKTVFENLSCLLEFKSGIITSVISQNTAEASEFLKIIAGIDSFSKGKIEFAVDGKNSERVNTVYIPQKPSSFPWLSVQEDVETGVQQKNLLNEDFKKRIKNILNETGLEGYETHYPHNRSLGFRFRISMARALANNPDLIILDNPFTELDPVTKEEIKLLIKSIATKEPVMILAVLTDPFEAASLSDTVLLLNLSSKNMVEGINLSDLSDIAKIKKLTEKIAEQKIDKKI